MNDFADILKSKNYGLVLPREYDDEINRYVRMHSGDRENAEYRPFRLQVDFWAFSVATALALELAPREGSVGQWGKVFIYTSQGILNNDLSSLLAVVAIAKFGHECPDVGEPSRVIDLANRLAATGCREVIKEFTTSNPLTTPLDRVLEFSTRLQDEMKYME